MNIGRLAVSYAVLGASAFCLSRSGASAGESRPDPEAHRTRTQRRLGKRSGEDFCWQAAYIANDFLAAYEAWEDTAWLKQAEIYYDYCISRLKKDPDGYEGWIGRSYSIDRLHHDTVVGDAILCKAFLRFAEIVLGESAPPELKERFGDKARKYIELATRICWEKFNRRGQYYEDGGWGSYRTHSRYVDAQDWKWVDMPDRVISDNLNKHYAIGIVILRLWRLTRLSGRGKEKYRERVERIFGRAKAMFRYFRHEDRVVWNFWMPHGPYDMPGTAPKSWVGVHSSRAGYQASEVSMFVEVYDSGLVFERADLERMIRTNHWMAANGFKSADGTSKAGTVWGALARFDDQIRRECEKRLRAKRRDKNTIALAHLKTLTEKRLGWKRLYVKDPAEVRVTGVPLQDGRNVSMALVIPSTVEVAGNSRVKLATQYRANGKLRIELLDRTGREILGTLLEKQVDAKSGQYLAPRWDGTNPKTGRKDVGEYRVRWSLAGESRTEPVWVKMGRRRRRAGPPEIKPGESLAADFEGPAGQLASGAAGARLRAGKRWRLEGKGVGVSRERARGGEASLKIPPGARAVLTFADQDDLPVRIAVWIYDEGKKLGKRSANGGGWGVRTADGNTFCVRQCWRRYLNGDGEYAWFNTGENQWFTPHRSRVRRRTGWSEWVFDFTEAGRTRITCDGEPLATTGDWVPGGAVAVFLIGGSAEAGPIYVDDVAVQYTGER